MTDQTGFGNEFDYFDDWLDEDPFSHLIPMTCTNCYGLGTTRTGEIDYTCTWCGGSGVLK